MMFLVFGVTMGFFMLVLSLPDGTLKDILWFPGLLGLFVGVYINFNVKQKRRK